MVVRETEVNRIGWQWVSARENARNTLTNFNAYGYGVGYSFTLTEDINGMGQTGKSFDSHKLIVKNRFEKFKYQPSVMKNAPGYSTERISDMLTECDYVVKRGLSLKDMAAKSRSKSQKRKERDARKKKRRRERYFKKIDSRNKEKKQFRSRIEVYADRMRSRMTKAEIQINRSLKEIGVSFHPQYIIGRRIIDFYVPSVFLAIEADGSQHFTKEGVEADRIRHEEILKIEPRIRFARYANKFILGNPRIVEELRNKINQEASK